MTTDNPLEHIAMAIPHEIDGGTRSYIPGCGCGWRGRPVFIDDAFHLAECRTTAMLEADWHIQLAEERKRRS